MAENSDMNGILFRVYLHFKAFALIPSANFFRFSALDSLPGTRKRVAGLGPQLAIHLHLHHSSSVMNRYVIKAGGEISSRVSLARLLFLEPSAH